MLFSPLLVSIAFAALIVFYLARCIASPLWKLPGPFWSRITPLALRWNEFNATRTLYVHSLHLKYGPVVRIAPNEVSFTSYEAVKEIYGSLGSGYDKSSFYNLFRVFKRRYVAMLLADQRVLRADSFCAGPCSRPWKRAMLVCQLVSIILANSSDIACKAQAHHR